MVNRLESAKKALKMTVDIGTEIKTILIPKIKI